MVLFVYLIHVEDTYLTNWKIATVLHIVTLQQSSLYRINWKQRKKDESVNMHVRACTWLVEAWCRLRHFDYVTLVLAAMLTWECVAATGRQFTFSRWWEVVLHNHHTGLQSNFLLEGGTTSTPPPRTTTRKDWWSWIKYYRWRRIKYYDSTAALSHILSCARIPCSRSSGETERDGLSFVFLNSTVCSWFDIFV